VTICHLTEDDDRRLVQEIIINGNDRQTSKAVGLFWGRWPVEAGDILSDWRTWSFLQKLAMFTAP